MSIQQRRVSAKFLVYSFIANTLREGNQWNIKEWVALHLFNHAKVLEVEERQHIQGHKQIAQEGRRHVQAEKGSTV